MYRQSVGDPIRFWSEHGKRIDWIKPYTKIKDVSYAYDDVHIRWYYDGKLNAAANCIDRHLETRGDQTAIIWEGDDPNEDLIITYKELHEHVSKFANGLKAIGAKKGDRICIYMPMIPEAAYAMLACARIGAIHSVVFGGFSPDALGAFKIAPVISSLQPMACAAVNLFLLKQIRMQHWNHAPLLRNVSPSTHRRRHQLKNGRDIWYHDLWPGNRRIVNQKKWMPKTRSSFSILLAPPANRKASCIPPAAIWFMPQ